MSCTPSKYRTLQPTEEGLSVWNDDEGLNVQQQTRNKAKEDTHPPFPCYGPYNPSKYADTTTRNSHVTNCNPSPRNRLGRDSEYASDIVAAHSNPPDGSQVLLDSSARFYPTPTFMWNETTNSKVKYIL